MTEQTSDIRLEQMRSWLEGFAQTRQLDLDTLCPASSDAGFRRYFRVATKTGGSFIVMDAPPALERTEEFLRVGALMKDAGVNVPEVHEKNQQDGFLLLEDFGRETFLDILDEQNASSLMNAATDQLVLWQAASRPGVLPEYDEAVLRREIGLFDEWYLKVHHKFEMNDRQRAILGKTIDKIVAQNLSQAKVFVHRDFMPRNLMRCSDGRIGVLDFQDALYGPVSYDIASLMRDAFLSWGESFTLDISIRYWQKARKAGIPVPADFGEFWRDIEWMGIQRHLKVLGIFARINYRDGKPKYLADTPRFIHYVRQTANRYDELKPINWLLDHFEDQKTRVGFTY